MRDDEDERLPAPREADYETYVDYLIAIDEHVKALLTPEEKKIRLDFIKGIIAIQEYLGDD